MGPALRRGEREFLKDITMTITDIDPPGAEPIDLLYAKTFLRIDHDEDDGLIADLIISAREQLESLIRGTLITRRRLYTSDNARYGFFINHSPVTVVHRVGVVAGDGTVTDVPMVDITLNLRSTPPAVCLNNRKRWSDYVGDAIAVEVELDAGYGTAGDIPMPL